MAYVRRRKWYANYSDENLFCSKCDRRIFDSDDEHAERFYVMCENCFNKKIEPKPIRASERQTLLKFDVEGQKEVE